jgi:hypothetical protein
MSGKELSVKEKVMAIFKLLLYFPACNEENDGKFSVMISEPQTEVRSQDLRIKKEVLVLHRDCRHFAFYTIMSKNTAASEI